MKMLIEKAQPATLASVLISKIEQGLAGERVCGSATGFHYRDSSGQPWLVTNWHVLTGRRPDDPGSLLKGYNDSPFAIDVTYTSERVGQYWVPHRMDLYQDGRPVWRQARLDIGLDLAAIKVEMPEGTMTPCIQDFCEIYEDLIEPGMTVATIGYPFGQSDDWIMPIWKSGMIASEPGYLHLKQVQVLLDMPGAAGMSGAPVYVVREGLRVAADQYHAIRASKVDQVDLTALAAAKPKMGVQFVGVYSGSTQIAALERLSLGRFSFASAVHELVNGGGEEGANPYPPSFRD